VSDCFSVCSGKSTLLNTIAGQVSGTFQTIPTIGSDLQQFVSEGVTMKCWDLGGQTKFRSGWQRYAKGCDVIIFVVDANAVRNWGFVC
jgi:Arf/Sar family protein